MGVGDVYSEGRLRISDLVAGLADDEVERGVPTCPSWTVGDVVAHLVGICADVVAGNVAGVATDPWTAEQVRARKGRRVTELVEEWSDVGSQVEAFADSFPADTGSQWVADLTSHEHDIRTAIGRPGARDSQGVDVGLHFLVAVGLHQAVCGRGLPPLVVRADERSWVVGSGETAETDKGAPVALVAPPFELFRALTGRRSLPQIRRLGWSVDPDPYLPAFQFGPFTISDHDIAEPG